MKLRRKVAVVTLSIGAALALAIAPAGAAADLSADAEDGTLNAFGGSSNASVTDTGAAYGNLKDYTVSSSATTGYLNITDAQLDDNYDCFSLRFYVNPNSVGTGESLDIASVKHDGTGNVNHADFFRVASADTWKWDLLSSDNDTAPGSGNLNDWDRIEMRGCFGTDVDQSVFKMGVKIEGGDQGEITSTGQATDADVKQVYFGSQSSKTHVQEYDGIRIVLSDSADGSLPAWLGAA